MQIKNQVAKLLWGIICRCWIAVTASVLTPPYIATQSVHGSAIDWVTVGDAGNAADNAGVPSPAGAVPYEFRIMKYEFTNGQYVEFLNSVDPDGLNPFGIYRVDVVSDPRKGIDFTPSNALGLKYTPRPNMGDKPVNVVSWFDAARVANWMDAGGIAYETTTAGSIAINTGVYDFQNTPRGDAPAKAANAKFWIPTENEWYKAAYYKGGTTDAGYWRFATQADLAPLPVKADETGNGSMNGVSPVQLGNFANLGPYPYEADWNGANGNVTTVGSNGGPSSYGAYDLTGNVAEWNSLDGLGGTQVGIRGGGWASSSPLARSTYRVLGSPQGEQLDTGFRLAGVPVASVVTLTIDVAFGDVATQNWMGFPRLIGLNPVMKNGLGTLVLDAANTLSSSLSVKEGTVLAANPQALGTATLNVASGATFAIAPEIGALNAVQIEKLGTIAGTLDVGVGRFTLGSSSGAVESAKSLLVSGRNGGGWDGSAGITSTAAAADLQNGIVRSVGWKSNSDGSVTVACAAPGDTNLDGEVNVFDLVNVNGSGTYGRGNPSNWSQGDFDYNGVTNIFDMVQTNGAGVYGRGSYLPATPPSVNAVPEPASWLLAFTGLVSGYSMVRRRVA